MTKFTKVPKPTEGRKKKNLRVLACTNITEVVQSADLNQVDQNVDNISFTYVSQPLQKADVNKFKPMSEVFIALKNAGVNFPDGFFRSEVPIALKNAGVNIPDGFFQSPCVDVPTSLEAMHRVDGKVYVIFTLEFELLFPDGFFQSEVPIASKIAKMKIPDGFLPADWSKVPTSLDAMHIRDGKVYATLTQKFDKIQETP